MAQYASPALRANFNHLYWDVAGFGILAGSTLYFQSIYAARLGANALQIGLITAGPAVMALLTTLPAGRWISNKPLIKVSIWGSLLQRLAFLLFITLPWLFNPASQIAALIVISLIFTIPGVIFTISFNAMFPELVPAEYRSEVIGKRNAIVAVSLTLTNISCGLLLDALPTPLNYQLVFVLGAAGAMLSSFHLSRLKLLTVDWITNSPPRAGKPTMLRLDLLAGPFGLFMLSYFAFYAFQYMPSPLFTLSFVNELRLTDGEIGLGNAFFYLMMTLASLFLFRLSNRFGNRRLLLSTISCFGFYPIFLAIVWQPWIFWVVSGVGGVVYGLISGAMLNRLMERVPDQDRPAHMALHNLALNLGILCGSFLGPFAGELVGLRTAVFVVGVLRAMVGLLIWWWG